LLAESGSLGIAESMGIKVGKVTSNTEARHPLHDSAANAPFEERPILVVENPGC
jgi:hypothetical protein